MPSALSSTQNTLCGTFVYGMDRKGRVVMPGRFRRLLGSPFVLTRAPGQALLALSASQWQALVARHGESVLFRGYYLSAAAECRVDEATGRFLIPRSLRQYANLQATDEVAITGVGRAVQVWKRALWEAAVQVSEFPSLGQLDLELEVLPPPQAAPYRQRVGRPLGLLLVECRGRFDGRAVRRLAITVLRLLAEKPPVLIIDARHTGGTQAALSLITSILQPRLEENSTELWIVGNVQTTSEHSTVILPDLDAVLWRLAALPAADPTS
ncbi:MAG: hypothetical protein HY320_03095 [Armatimonadetes bacterium]|nr:hypothetical protein [Armatimonadota bacterium]